MTAKEATPQDWEALKNRIERRHTGVFPAGTEETAIQAIESNTMERAENWPGTEDIDLWITVMNRTQRRSKFQDETDQAIRAANWTKIEPKPERQTNDSAEREALVLLGSLIFSLGAVAGVMLTLLLQIIL
ncbi:MAG: hypothetical protein IJ206_09390 [Oscillospiraceae bacterium]|nr:hypothetical protein [Oscillospiraceae bacterium]